MKFSAISATIAATVLALSTNANANPIEHAQCSAIFKALQITVQQDNPAAANIVQNASVRLKNLSASVIGESTASTYYIIKMNEMTAEKRAGNGTGIDRNEMAYCMNMAKSFGML